MDPKHSHGPDRIDYQELPGDLTEVHASIQREHAEPTAQTTPIPMWLTVTCGVAVLWAGLYLGFFNGGLKGDVFNELATTPALLFPAPVKNTGQGGAAVELSLAQQGKTVYANCVPCHQASGAGLPNQFPPLVKSEYVNGGEKRLVAILLKGIIGPIKVEGATFNGSMPPWEGTLNDKKIAAVASFVRSNFGNSAPEISAAKVAAARAEFAEKKTQLTEAEILQIPADATLPDAAGANAPAAAAPAAGAAAPTAAAAPTTAAPAAAATTTAAPATTAPAAAAPAGAAATPEQIAAGKMIYMTICIACHQPTGMGLFPVFPPLTKSPYVNGTPERFAAMILKGNAGPMTVDGKPYNNIMPGQEAMLDDTKIANVMTFVRNSFSNSAPAVTPDVVAGARKKFVDRKTPWSQAELDAWK